MFAIDAKKWNIKKQQQQKTATTTKQLSFVESITWPVFKLGRIHKHTALFRIFLCVRFFSPVLTYLLLLHCYCLLWLGIKQKNDSSKSFKNAIKLFFLLLFCHNNPLIMFGENIHKNLNTFRRSYFSYMD